jgi:hypothetical protein
MGKSVKVHTGSALPAVLLLVSALGGCSAPVESGEDLAAAGEPIEGGSIPVPATMNAGTVRLSIRHATGDTEVSCSGQVISRNSILTAASCFYNQGWFEGGWDNNVAVPLRAQHHNPDWSWEFLTWDGASHWVTASVLVQEAYVDYRDDGNSLAHGYDVAVVRTSEPLINVTSSDVTAIARSTSQRPEWSYAYGHGYYSDTLHDGNLRRGYLEALTWHTSSGSSSYRTVVSDYGAGDAHLCKGDIGGPWKMQTDTALVSGVQFGVTTTGSGAGNCWEGTGRAAMVAYHDPWIQARVEGGGGSCVVEGHAVLPYIDSWELMDISTLVCW